MRLSSLSTQTLLTAALVALVVPMAAAQPGRSSDPCAEIRGNNRPTHCEVREQTLPFPGVLGVDATPNGGIAVHGWDRGEVHVRARVVATADTEAEARSLAGQVQVFTDGGRIGARGPKTSDGASWSVGFDVMVPRQAALELKTTNGGITIEDVQGEMTFNTTNGGVTLRRVNGNVRGGTTNGGVRVELDGVGWIGEGLDVQTRNGGVRLAVPEGYSARLEASVQNGGLRVDFPVTVQGEDSRTISTDLGAGGPPLKVRTVNGGMTISKK